MNIQDVLQCDGICLERSSRARSPFRPLAIPRAVLLLLACARVEGLGLTVYVFGFRVLGFGLIAYGLGCRGGVMALGLQFVLFGW